MADALGAYQMQTGHVNEAIRLSNQTLAMNPALVLVRADLAVALLHTGHADETERRCERLSNSIRRLGLAANSWKKRKVKGGYCWCHVSG